MINSVYCLKITEEIMLTWRHNGGRYARGTGKTRQRFCLRAAAEEENVDMVKSLLERGVDTDGYGAE